MNSEKSNATDKKEPETTFFWASRPDGTMVKIPCSERYLRSMQESFAVQTGNADAYKEKERQK